MDLIYADENHKDIDIMKDYSFDLAYGSSENNFELTIDREKHCCSSGYFVYIEGTEYGGTIDEIDTDSDENTVTYKGRTWHGILEGKVIAPESGADYLIVSGDANEVLGTLINRLDIQSIFVSSSDNSGINIRNYQFPRYVKGYTGICKMLAANGAKLQMVYATSHIILSAVPFVDYSKDEEFDEDSVSLSIKKVYRCTNHMICLGRGELADREVIHLYADADGNISHTQSLTGIDEIVDTYDYPNADSYEELENGGIDRLLEENNRSSSNLNLDETDNIYDIGDYVGARDLITGIPVKTSITKKIITIVDDDITIEYKAGD